MLLKRKELTPEQIEMQRAQDFFDRAVPHEIRFFADHYIRLLRNKRSCRTSPTGIM